VPHFKPGKELRERVNIHEETAASEGSASGSAAMEHASSREGSLS
jgi:hypothetical protein